MNTKRAILYVSKSNGRSKQTTDYLMNFINKNLKMINKRIYIKIFRVTSKNKAEVKRRGIRQTPTLVVNGQKQMYVGLKQIVNVLMPKRSMYPPGIKSDSELVESFQKMIIDQGEDEEDDMDGSLQQRMSAMRAKKTYLAPSRTSRHQQSTGRQSDFRSDDDFMSRVDNIEQTPINYNEENGDLLLENYRLGIANEMRGGRRM